MEVVTRADGSVHVRLDTTPVKPRARPPAVDRYALQEAEDARRREAAERMEARRRARCSPKPPRTRAVDRLCARDGLRAADAAAVARRALALALPERPESGAAGRRARRAGELELGRAWRSCGLAAEQRGLEWVVAPRPEARLVGERRGRLPGRAPGAGPGVPPRVTMWTRGDGMLV